jgi:hypothetical protein
MRALLAILISLCACWASAQEKPAVVEPPRTLEEAHQQLESMLSTEALARIDAMKSEKEMIEFHLGLGITIRNKWGLLGGSPLANNLWKQGFSHPDDMSEVILRTFWCKRHGKDLNLEERADYYQALRKAAAGPPPTARDPADRSEVEWTMVFDAGTDERPRKIHVGRSKTTGRWLAYEFNKGVYVPTAELARKIKVSANDPFAGGK